MIVGVDPGKDGALAAVDPDNTFLTITTMPLIRGAKRDAYDLAKILDWLSGADHVFVESLQAMPLRFGGSLANHARGYSMGLFETACAALKKPITLVRPRDWQSVMLAGTSGDDTKQRSIVAVKRLFPEIDLRRTTRCKNDHDGMADAALIAEYGRRQLRKER